MSANTFCTDNVMHHQLYCTPLLVLENSTSIYWVRRTMNSVQRWEEICNECPLEYEWMMATAKLVRIIYRYFILRTPTVGLYCKITKMALWWIHEAGWTPILKIYLFGTKKLLVLQKCTTLFHLKMYYKNMVQNLKCC